jgi:hypothetical protein
MAAVGFPARVKKIHTPRRRLPVTIFYEAAAPVKIRHVSQNLGTVINEIQPAQARRI